MTFKLANHAETGRLVLMCVAEHDHDEAVLNAFGYAYLEQGFEVEQAKEEV